LPFHKAFLQPPFQPDLQYHLVPAKDNQLPHQNERATFKGLQPVLHPPGCRRHLWDGLHKLRCEAEAQETQRCGIEPGSTGTLETRSRQRPDTSLGESCSS